MLVFSIEVRVSCSIVAESWMNHRESSRDDNGNKQVNKKHARLVKKSGVYFRLVQQDYLCLIIDI